MVEDSNKTTKKKTLSLKLGSSIKTSPAKNFDGGSTVIVERKRARKNISTTIEKNITEPKLHEILVYGNNPDENYANDKVIIAIFRKK